MIMKMMRITTTTLMRARVLYKILDGLEEDAAAAVAEYWAAVEKCWDLSPKIDR
jgi:hypothetical protein